MKSSEPLTLEEEEMLAQEYDEAVLAGAVYRLLATVRHYRQRAEAAEREARELRHLMAAAEQEGG